jgi:hypothetical protein
LISGGTFRALAGKRLLPHAVRAESRPDNEGRQFCEEPEENPISANQGINLEVK